jgi:pimeloyl-ACP methyl ester carboxylesterase/DNA-binding CsgD family transcriptional regulator
MNADITFCSTADGTKLALSTQGAGTDVVMAPVHFCDDLDAPGPASRPWLDALLPCARVTRYDGRGCGLSDRDATRFTFDAWVEDLDAVVQTLGGGPVALVAHSHGTPLAVHYASVHPQRVSHLVAYGGFVRGRSRRDSSEAQIQETKAHREAILAGWGGDTPYSAGFRRVFIMRYFPHASEELIAQLDAAACRRWSSEVALAYSSEGWNIDVSEQARSVRCPSLIFHATHDQAFPLDEGRRLAALIPGSRFMRVESENHLPLESDLHWPSILREVKAFLGLEGNSAQRGGRGALTPRQIEVLRLVAAGQTDKQIARSLGLSPRTVEMHVGHALETLQCRSRAEAVRTAMQMRLLG